MNPKIPAIIAGLATLGTVAQAASLSNLAHRWSMDNVDDSGSAGNVAPLTVNGTAALAGGLLVLPGGGARTNNASMAIGATIAGNASLTVETWFTMGTGNGNWSKAWMFGTSTDSYMDFTPRSGDGDQISSSIKSSGIDEVNTRGGSTVIDFDQSYLATVVYDDPNDLITLYLNGAVVGSKAWTGQVSELGNTAENYIGSAVGFGDGDFLGSVDEMRIWNTALTASEVAADAAAGPNNIAVPEPSALLISCLGGLALFRRRRA